MKPTSATNKIPTSPSSRSEKKTDKKEKSSAPVAAKKASVPGERSTSPNSRAQGSLSADPAEKKAKSTTASSTGRSSDSPPRTRGTLNVSESRSKSGGKVKDKLLFTPLKNNPSGEVKNYSKEYSHGFDKFGNLSEYYKYNELKLPNSKEKLQKLINEYDRLAVRICLNKVPKYEEITLAIRYPSDIYDEITGERCAFQSALDKLPQEVGADEIHNLFKYMSAICGDRIASIISPSPEALDPSSPNDQQSHRASLLYQRVANAESTAADAHSFEHVEAIASNFIETLKECHALERTGSLYKLNDAGFNKCSSAADEVIAKHLYQNPPATPEQCKKTAKMLSVELSNILTEALLTKEIDEPGANFAHPAASSSSISARSGASTGSTTSTASTSASATVTRRTEVPKNAADLSRRQYQHKPTGTSTSALHGSSDSPSSHSGAAQKAGMPVRSPQNEGPSVSSSALDLHSSTSSGRVGVSGNASINTERESHAPDSRAAFGDNPVSHDAYSLSAKQLQGFRDSAGRDLTGVKPILLTDENLLTTTSSDSFPPPIYPGITARSFKSQQDSGNPESTTSGRQSFPTPHTSSASRTEAIVNKLINLTGLGHASDDLSIHFQQSTNKLLGEIKSNHIEDLISGFTNALIYTPDKKTGKLVDLATKIQYLENFKDRIRELGPSLASNDPATLKNCYGELLAFQQEIADAIAPSSSPPDHHTQPAQHSAASEQPAHRDQTTQPSRATPATTPRLASTSVETNNAETLDQFKDFFEETLQLASCDNIWAVEDEINSTLVKLNSLAELGINSDTLDRAKGMLEYGADAFQEACDKNPGRATDPVFANESAGNFKKIVDNVVNLLADACKASKWNIPQSAANVQNSQAASSHSTATVAREDNRTQSTTDGQPPLKNEPRGTPAHSKPNPALRKNDADARDPTSLREAATFKMNQPGRTRDIKEAKERYKDQIMNAFPFDEVDYAQGMRLAEEAHNLIASYAHQLVEQANMQKSQFSDGLNTLQNAKDAIQAAINKYNTTPSLAATTEYKAAIREFKLALEKEAGFIANQFDVNKIFFAAPEIKSSAPTNAKNTEASASVTPNVEVKDTRLKDWLNKNLTALATLRENYAECHHYALENGYLSASPDTARVSVHSLIKNQVDGFMQRIRDKLEDATDHARQIPADGPHSADIETALKKLDSQINSIHADIQHATHAIQHHISSGEYLENSLNNLRKITDSIIDLAKMTALRQHPLLEQLTRLRDDSIKFEFIDAPSSAHLFNINKVKAHFDSLPDKLDPRALRRVRKDIFFNFDDIKSIFPERSHAIIKNMIHAEFKSPRLNMSGHKDEDLRTFQHAVAGFKKILRDEQWLNLTNDAFINQSEADTCNIVQWQIYFAGKEAFATLTSDPVIKRNALSGNDEALLQKAKEAWSEASRAIEYELEHANKAAQ